MASTTTIRMKNGEGKWLRFTFTNAGVAVDVTLWTFELAIKKNINDLAYIIRKLDASFNKALGATGVVRVNIPASETVATELNSGSYVGELKYTSTADTDVGKSATFDFEIEKAVTV